MRIIKFDLMPSRWIDRPLFNIYDSWKRRARTIVRHGISLHTRFHVNFLNSNDTHEYS